MDVIESIYHRRSVRAFTTDAVPSEVIDALVSAAVQAPSAMNLQPWAFLIIEGRGTLSQFSEWPPSRNNDTRLAAFPLSRSVI
jgi:nitroreductase